MKFLFNQLTAALVLPPLWMMGGHPAQAEQPATDVWQAVTSAYYRKGWDDRERECQAAAARVQRYYEEQLKQARDGYAPVRWPEKSKGQKK